MGLIEGFVRHIGHPLWLAYKGQANILRHLRDYDRLWRTGRAELQELQHRRLSEILRHTAATSAFYRECWQKHGVDLKVIMSIADLARLPLIRKTDLNANMERVLSTGFVRSELTESSTGGSTGQPLTFFRDAEVTAMRRAQDYFFNSKIGVYPGTKRAWVWGSPLDVAQLNRIKARLANLLTDRAIHFYAFDSSRMEKLDFLRLLNKYQPRLIIAYPNMLAALAELARSENMAMTSVPYCAVTAEPLYPWQRELFREVFATTTCERYGAREFGTLASEIDDGHGMVVFEPNYLLEVIDAEGRVLPEGSFGELVLTDLCNRAFPLIRYRTGDMVRISTSGAGSESQWRRLLEVGGRIVDLLRRPDGELIGGAAAIMALRTSGIRIQTQIVQHEPQRFALHHLRGEEVTAEQRRLFQEKLTKLMGATVTVETHAVDALPYDRSGKYRYVISECVDHPSRQPR